MSVCVKFNFNYDRSKLGALFGMDKSGDPGGNASLTYTAPKQPKKKGMYGSFFILSASSYLQNSIPFQMHLRI